MNKRRQISKRNKESASMTQDMFFLHQLSLNWKDSGVYRTSGSQSQIRKARDLLEYPFWHHTWLVQGCLPHHGPLYHHPQFSQTLTLTSGRVDIQQWAGHLPVILNILPEHECFLQTDEYCLLHGALKHFQDFTSYISNCRTVICDEALVSIFALAAGCGWNKEV